MGDAASKSSLRRATAEGGSLSLAVSRNDVVGQQPRERWRGRLVASRRASFELRPDVLRHLAPQVAELVRY